MAHSHLPSDAFRAILEFMDRKQLVELAAVNRQFYFVINSLPFTVKPLSRIYLLLIHSPSRFPENMEWRVWWIWKPASCDFGPASGNDLESLLKAKWLRIENVSIRLPADRQEAHALLDLLEKHSHCLLGSNFGVRRSWIAEHRGEEIPPEIAEHVDNIKSRFETINRR